VRAPTLDYEHEEAVDGRIVEVTSRRIVVDADVPGCAQLDLREDVAVVVMTREVYEALVTRKGGCEWCDE